MSAVKETVGCSHAAMARVIVLTSSLGLLTSCVLSAARSTNRAGDANESNDDRVTPGQGAAYSIEQPTRELEAAATPFAGSCAFARPPGDEPYSLVLTIPMETRVYATANFSAGNDQRIGYVGPSGSVHASGPIAGGAGSEAGFAVLLVDTNGRVCRGYLPQHSTAPLNHSIKIDR